MDCRQPAARGAERSCGVLAAGSAGDVPPPDRTRGEDAAGTTCGATPQLRAPRHPQQAAASAQRRQAADGARDEYQVHRFVVSISPDNLPSLGLAAKLGFRKIGSHIDELDGPEDIFERSYPSG